MADRAALVRLLDELLWSLRRDGFAIATSQAIDVVRAIEVLGWDDRDNVREAIASIVVKRARERRRFDASFDRFMDARRDDGSLWHRLGARGFTEDELGELRALLAQMARAQRDVGQHLGTLLERGPALDRLFRLAGITRTLDAMQSPLQVGFYTHRVLAALGVPEAKRALGALADRLRDAMGDRAQSLVAALNAEIELASDEVRAHVKGSFDRRAEAESEDASARRLDLTPFEKLGDAELEEVARAVRRFAERLRGGERVRRRRATRGRIDPARTFRRALATGGVPFSPARRARRRDGPELLLLCDVSDSVRSAARFMLELTYAAQDLFDRTRTFVFVSELGETTKLFARESVSSALGQAFGGGVVSVASNSNYGRVLRTFEERHLLEVGRHTTVVLLGDGRSNYHDDGAEVLRRVRARARAVYFLCPEARGRWATGDSAMARYEPVCTRVLEVRTARDLEAAARMLLAGR